MKKLLPCLALGILTACPSADDPVDAGVDAGGGLDVGTPDTGARDVGGADGGGDAASDGGPPTDTGTDAGPNDTGVGADAGGGSFTERLIDGDGTTTHGQGAELFDFEGDGDLDLVVAFSLADTVRIYINDGSGNFTTMAPLPDGAIVGMHAAVADFDGDGDMDVAAAGLFDRTFGFGSQGEVTWWRNDGATPWTRVEITGFSVFNPFFIRAGDLTGEGRPDLVVGALDFAGDGNGVYWSANDGSGFGALNPIEADLPYVSTALIHDVDGDGVLDVVASAYFGDEIVWYENLRNGVDPAPMFQRHTIGTPSAPYGVEIAQMDGDPQMELVSTGDNFNGGAIYWWDPPADPRNAWTQHTVSADYGGGEGTRVHAADLDGDGDTDVAMSSFAQGEIRVFFNDGGGGFTPVAVEADHPGANWIQVGDLDGDQRVDLVTTTYEYPGGDRISWWDNE